MAISFNDNELRTTSGVILETPQEIAQSIANKASAIQGKADSLEKDDANKVFYNNSLNIVEQYHAELAAIDGTQKTLYLNTDLEDSGKLLPGNVHFPVSPIWVNFPPKITASMNGNPTALLVDHEIFRTGELNSNIDLIKNGFTYGAVSNTLDLAYAGGTTFELTTASGFSSGDWLVLSGGGSSALVEFVSATAVAPFIATVVVLAPVVGSVSAGGTVRNFFAGFNNAQRESGVSIYGEVFEYFKTLIVTEKDALKVFLQAEKDALDLNDAIGAEATEVTTAKAEVQAALDYITTWEGLPLTGAGSQYGNTGILNLETVIANRSLEAIARATQIMTHLGAVSQAGNGDLTGTGQYSTLAKWINFRINKSAGTLRVFYDFDQIIAFIDSTILIATSKKAEYDLYMLVKRIVSNPNGTAIIGLEDAAGLNIGDSIKIIDDVQPSMVALVNNIVGNIVTLDTIVPATYTIANNARLIKLL